MLLWYTSVRQSRACARAHHQTRTDMNANTLEQHILSIVCSVFDAYSAVLFLPSENGEEHYLAASFSLGEGVEQGAMLSSGSLVDWIIRNR